ncbi:carbohydrate ABC transporter permease [Devosia rhodophyticola]|uniref:Carbohydrate ABC transporter permease n=1 Tax=Devosia rhodophyticola TaxID=3026423 RepID=A0ABY7YU64_9HYPH|nr:carbohydrate ABC transporter permease [Devosia rhodophyticola]WDR04742.1 carbohydrate ABC transporter permease [Devosia rhodophyticola]
MQRQSIFRKPAAGGRNSRSLVQSVALYAGVAVFVLWILLPVWYLVISSLITPQQLGSRSFSFFPTSITFDNYLSVLTGSTGGAGIGSTDIGSRLLPAIGQSFLVSSILVVLNLIVAGAAAYALSRYPFPGSRRFELAVIATRVVPAIAIIGPFFVAFRVIGVLNSPWALVISYNVFTLPLAIMIMKNYFDQLPREVEEAAKIDGAGRLQTLLIIILPIARPGLVAAGVLIFLEAWSEFFYSLVLTNQLTVPSLLAGFQSVQQFNWNALAAATVMSMIPPVLLVMVFQRNVVGSLTAGVGK